MNQLYTFEGSEHVITPALIYYPKIIRENIEKSIQIAHGAEHLWPHVKTHKTSAIVNMSIEYGITRFKCATIAEAEMTARCGASHIVLAYPLIGPNISRFLHLSEAFPDVNFYAIGDDRNQLELLGNAALQKGSCADVLIDVDMGMNRTGVAISELETFSEICSNIPGISLKGLHCYDGHRTEHDYGDRLENAHATDKMLSSAISEIQKKHPECTTLILGGSPSFPCHADFPNAYFSPGTIFIHDYGYSQKFPDLPFTSGAAILTRVISCPKEGHFTLDLGYKGIASDPEGLRGKIVGLEHCVPLFQCEEHWAYQMLPGHEAECPKVGDEFFVIPTHICPTSALYPSVLVSEEGKLTDEWEVTARNRIITY